MKEINKKRKNEKKKDFDIEIKKIKKTAEYISLSNDLEKSIYLKSKIPKLSFVFLSEYFGINRFQIQRAFKANEEKREIGKRGRPSLLNEKETEELIEELLRRDREGNPETPSELKRLAQKISPKKEFSNRFPYDFLERHKDRLKLNNCSIVEQKRSGGSTP